MPIAPDFWESKTTWSAIGGIVSAALSIASAVTVTVCHREDLLPLVTAVGGLLTAIFGFLQIAFVRDNVQRTGDRLAAAHQATVRALAKIANHAEVVPREEGEP